MYNLTVKTDASSIISRDRRLGGSALHCDIGARTHGDADIRRRQGKGVVHAVTGHGDDAALSLQLRDDCALLIGNIMTSSIPLAWSKLVAPMPARGTPPGGRSLNKGSDVGIQIFSVKQKRSLNAGN